MKASEGIQRKRVNGTCEGAALGETLLVRTDSIKRPFKIGTWNVRNLSQKSKLAIVVKEIERLDVAIVETYEMQWKNCGKLEYGNQTVIYSSHESKAEKEFD